jgi:hypothetical protein
MMAINCITCGAPMTAPMKVSLWYMHDDHTFTRISGTLDQIVDEARRLGIESPYGMLGPVRVLGPNDVVFRIVGDSIHARKGFAEADLARWKGEVLADPEVVSLLVSATSSENVLSET